MCPYVGRRHAGLAVTADCTRVNGGQERNEKRKKETEGRKEKNKEKGNRETTKLRLQCVCVRVVETERSVGFGAPGECKNMGRSQSVDIAVLCPFFSA